jgi:hypothetical protein
VGANVAAMTAAAQTASNILGIARSIEVPMQHNSHRVPLVPSASVRRRSTRAAKGNGFTPQNNGAPVAWDHPRRALGGAAWDYYFLTNAGWARCRGEFWVVNIGRRVIEETLSSSYDGGATEPVSA